MSRLWGRRGLRLPNALSGLRPLFERSPNAYHFGRVPSTLQWRFSRSIIGPTYAKG